MRSNGDESGGGQLGGQSRYEKRERKREASAVLSHSDEELLSRESGRAVVAKDG
jgi:hypothetical protein